MHRFQKAAAAAMLLVGTGPVLGDPKPIIPSSLSARPHDIQEEASHEAFRMPETITVPLSFKEKRGVDLSNAWKDRPELPREGPNGEITYLFGATLPTLVCSPLTVCTIALERGEKVNNVSVGDAARWRISPSTTGDGPGQTTLVVVKPTQAGLITNLFLTTDRRAYVIKLASDQSNWMPMLSFDYPANMEAEWAAYKQRIKARETQAFAARRRGTIPYTGGQNLAHLNFNYALSGDRTPWRPVRVYTDGSKTYIQFPGGSFPDGAPALVALAKGGDPVMVNYRLLGDRYVVDRVLYNAELVVGTGRNQERVRITKVGGK